MRTGFILFFLLLFFSFLTIAVTAVPFTPIVSPDGMNGGQSSQLLNFSVQNSGSVNITQVNITLPPGFTFTGSSGTTTTSSYTASTSTPSWVNTSSLGLVGNSTTQSFWIYANTPSTTASYSFNITTLDANGVFNSSNVSVAIFDTLAPTYSSNTTSPATNSSYTAGQSYWFNVTWADGVGVSKVLIEHNITGSSSIHNETMSNSSSVYYFNVSDLAAGVYLWRVYANDTNNTFNTTPQLTYEIRKASNTLNVYLNGSLNSNITSTNNTAVNITVNATCNQTNCNISVSRDGTTIASTKPNPYFLNDTLTSVGLHNYTISISSNTNFTGANASYYVATVPTYSTSTSNLPLTYSNTTIGSLNITFDTNAALSDIKIQGDWSGTTTNYSMTNSTGTSYYYNITFPAGTSTWKIYGIYSNHSFNLTGSNTFTINKASPNLVLSTSPQWTLDTPVQTNVSCSVSLSVLTVTLYKNGSAISNHDVQTFAAGSIYVYLCNNTANQNYTTETVTNTLIIRAKPLAALSFVQTPTSVEVVQNSTATREIKVKNNGNVAQNVTIEIEGLDSSWYSFDKTTALVLGGRNESFSVTFNIANFDVKDYPAKFNAKGPNGTISQDFTLRILPSDSTKVKINDTIALYKLDVSKLESKFDEIKAKINNTGAIEQKLNELKVAVKQAEDYVASNNYFQAQQTFETIKGLIAEVESQLKVAEAPAETKLSKNVVYVVVGIVIVIVVGIFAYLFWPKRGFKPQTEYEYGGPIGKEGLFDKLKNLINKLKRRKKTEVALPEK